MSFKSIDERIKGKLQNIGFQETRPIYHKFKNVVQREGEQLNEHFTKYMEKYYKEHGSGNPNYTIENWVNPNFVATPAFWAENKYWIEYLKEQKTKEHSRIDYQIENLNSVSKIAWKYRKKD